MPSHDTECREMFLFTNIHGSFNIGESDTFKRNDTPPFFIDDIYFDALYFYANGICGYDTVGLESSSDGTRNIADLLFGVANVTTLETGILGLGLTQLAYDSEFQETLLMKMKRLIRNLLIHYI